MNSIFAYQDAKHLWIRIPVINIWHVEEVSDDVLKCNQDVFYNLAVLLLIEEPHLSGLNDVSTKSRMQLSKRQLWRYLPGRTIRQPARCKGIVSF